jgi:pyruvate formate lyase activating enzyme
MKGDAMEDKTEVLKGRINSFQSMGAVDGPGIRFVVFMQGCPLRCACCHNPDTWDPKVGDDYGVEEVFEKILRCRHISVITEA